tara:strand:- start:22652 stop:23242 length:591 start_codon:yes stop_codon:yes gene_type:complete
MLAHTREDLEAKTSRQLVEIFNAIPGVQTVTRFSSRMSGVNRILTIQPDVRPVAEPIKPAAAPASLEEIVNAPFHMSSQHVIATEAPPKLTWADTGTVRDEVDIAVDYLAQSRPRRKATQGTYNLTGGVTKRNYRENTQRGKLLHVLMVDGATFDRLLILFPQWDASHLHRTIRMLSNHFGFDFTTDDAGVIRASR